MAQAFSSAAGAATGAASGAAAGAFSSGALVPLALASASSSSAA